MGKAYSTAPVVQTKVITSPTPIVEAGGKHGPTIALTPNSRFPFRFGVTKAKLILERLDAIRDFVAGFDKASPATDEERLKTLD